MGVRKSPLGCGVHLLSLCFSFPFSYSATQKTGVGGGRPSTAPTLALLLLVLHVLLLPALLLPFKAGAGSPDSRMIQCRRPAEFHSLRRQSLRRRRPGTPPAAVRGGGDSRPAARTGGGQWLKAHREGTDPQPAGLERRDRPGRGRPANCSGSTRQAHRARRPRRPGVSVTPPWSPLNPEDLHRGRDHWEEAAMSLGSGAVASLCRPPPRLPRFKVDLGGGSGASCGCPRGAGLAWGAQLLNRHLLWEP